MFPSLFPELCCYFFLLQDVDFARENNVNVIWVIETVSVNTQSLSSLSLSSQRFMNNNKL